MGKGVGKFRVIESNYLIIYQPPHAFCRMCYAVKKSFPSTIHSFYTDENRNYSVERTSAANAVCATKAASSTNTFPAFFF